MQTVANERASAVKNAASRARFDLNLFPDFFILSPSSVVRESPAEREERTLPDSSCLAMCLRTRSWLAWHRCLACGFGRVLRVAARASLGKAGETHSTPCFAWSLRAGSVPPCGYWSCGGGFESKSESRGDSRGSQG